MRKKRRSQICLIIALIILTLGLTSERIHHMESSKSPERFEATMSFGILNASDEYQDGTDDGEWLVFRYRYWMIAIGVLLILGMMWIFTLNHLVMIKTKALFESNERLKLTQSQNKAIINAIPDLIFMLDNETTIKEYKSEGFETPFADSEPLIGKKLSELLPVPYGEKLHELILNQSPNNALQTLEFKMALEENQRHFEMRLMRSATNEIVVLLRDMTSHFEKLENIKYLSYHDQLTGLYNRYMLEEELTRLDVPRNYPLSIIMADVNGLKLVNDCFGHPKGDELLKIFSSILKKGFRQDDILCRIGGDEFIVILPKTSNEVAEQLIDRIRVTCNASEFLNINISAAFGCATKSSGSELIRDILKLSEDKMYKQKLIEAPTIKEQMVNKLLQSLFNDHKAEATHAKEVEKYSLLLGEALDLNSSEMLTLKNASLHHDIGKVAIKYEILEKDGPLESDEMYLLRTHSEIGYRILSVINEMSESANIILAHHERWDGTGYPKGLKGDEIPLLSRIVVIADAFAAMTNPSFYKKTMTFEEALEELERCSGTQFDPILGRTFCGLIREQIKNQKI